MHILVNLCFKTVCIYIIGYARSYSWQTEFLFRNTESYWLPVGSSFLIRAKSGPPALGNVVLPNASLGKSQSIFFFPFLVVPCGMWDLSYLKTDLTHVPCSGSEVH